MTSNAKQYTVCNTLVKQIAQRGQAEADGLKRLRDSGGQVLHGKLHEPERFTSSSLDTTHDAANHVGRFVLACLQKQWYCSLQSYCCPFCSDSRLCILERCSVSSERFPYEKDCWFSSLGCLPICYLSVFVQHRNTHYTYASIKTTSSDNYIIR